MAQSPESFFQRLTRLFRSGPAIQRRVKGHDARSYYNSHMIHGNYGYRASAPFGFGRENSPFSVLGSYGILDRMARYAEFSEMEYTPEIATAIDIYADEVVGGDDRGKAFHIYSNNLEIKRALEDLFYDVLNVEFNLKTWTRNLVKYGDFFLFNEVLPDVGVINVTPIPVSEIEREEGYDLEDPYAVRFKWLTRGNQYLENWQVSHFRILGNDLFLPYGTSILEPARRIWRQLIMLEDAMLTYRVVRSPERRVFYIDVANVPPNDVQSYMDAVKATLRSHGNLDRNTGRADERHNAMSMLDDYYIPVRGDKQGTRVDTLQAGQHVTATEDVEYIQKKLFAALKVPKPYMNFDENLSAKASLAQMDIRFSRTIQGFQKILIAELNKLAMIHLFSKGFDGPDLIDFEIKLSNPSSVALQQKLELWSAKFELASLAKESRIVDEKWIQKNVIELTNDEIANIVQGLRIDRLREIELDTLEPVEPVENTPYKTTDPFDPTNYNIPGQTVPKEPMPQDDANDRAVTVSKFRSYDDEGNMYVQDLTAGQAPIKATPFLSRYKKNRRRRVGVGRGRQNTAMPDLAAMLSPRNKYTKDVHGQRTEAFERHNSLRSLMEEHLGEEELLDYNIKFEPNLTHEMKSIITRLKTYITSTKSVTGNSQMLSEDLDLEEIRIEQTEDNELLMEGFDLVDTIEEDPEQEAAVHQAIERSLVDVFRESDDS